MSQKNAGLVRFKYVATFYCRLDKKLDFCFRSFIEKLIDNKLFYVYYN